MKLKLREHKGRKKYEEFDTDKKLLVELVV